MILPRRKPTIGLFGGVGACVLGLSGCSMTSENAAELSLPQQNVERWVLPLDSYQWPLVDPVSDAEQVIVASCLAKVGYEWRVVPTEDGASPPESWSDAGRKLFSVGLADRYGYGNSPMLDQAQARIDADRANRAVSQQHPEAVDACFEETAPILGRGGTPGGGRGCDVSRLLGVCQGAVRRGVGCTGRRHEVACGRPRAVRPSTRRATCTRRVVPRREHPGGSMRPGVEPDVPREVQHRPNESLTVMHIGC